MISFAFTKRKILDSFKLKEFPDDHFKFDKNGGDFSKRVEKKTLGKREIARHEFIRPGLFVI